MTTRQVTNPSITLAPASALCKHSIMPTPVGHKFKQYGPSDATNPKVRRINPVTPWQTMVEENRIKQDLSYAKLNKLTGITASSLFRWTHDPLGAPPKSSYTAQVNKQLAEAIQVDPIDLARAYDESITAFTSPANPPAPPSQGIDALLDILTNSSKESYKTTEIIKLARMCRHSDA